MMRRLNALDWISLVLVIVGAINWGLVGLFSFNLVAFLFGEFTLLTRILYSLVGLAGLYTIATSVKVSEVTRYRTA